MIIGEDVGLTQGEKTHVLVIDDNRDHVHLITALLESLGCDVTSSLTGEEGIRIAVNAVNEQKAFNLIVTDIKLPDVDGPEVVAKIRAAGFKGGIVAFTAYPTMVGKKHAGGSGIEAYFSKAVLNKDLLVAILEQFAR